MITETGELSNLEFLLKVNEEARRLEITSTSTVENDPRAFLHKAVESKTAFGLFGLLLGALPPAAIYARLITSTDFLSVPALPFLFTICIVICGLVGRWFAGRLSFSVQRYRQAGFALSFVGSVFCGIAWGMVTGGLGGLVVFLFGGIVGAIVASAIAAVTFPLFVLLYYALSRGGMIESRQLWPIALGIPAIVAALILGL